MISVAQEDLELRSKMLLNWNSICNRQVDTAYLIHLKLSGSMTSIAEVQMEMDSCNEAQVETDDFDFLSECQIEVAEIPIVGSGGHLRPLGL